MARPTALQKLYERDCSHNTLSITRVCSSVLKHRQYKKNDSIYMLDCFDANDDIGKKQQHVQPPSFIPRSAIHQPSGPLTAIHATQAIGV